MEVDNGKNDHEILSKQVVPSTSMIGVYAVYPSTVAVALLPGQGPPGPLFA